LWIKEKAVILLNFAWFLKHAKKLFELAGFFGNHGGTIAAKPNVAPHNGNRCVIIHNSAIWKMG
jgi:hypothetical protein